MIQLIIHGMLKILWRWFGLLTQWYWAILPLVERERERRKTLILIHVKKCALTIERYIYIYKARSPNYHTCDLY